VLGVTQRGEAEQGVDRGQPGVAAADGVAPLMLEVIEERLILGASRSAMSRRHGEVRVR
jgi:hypothetical protein